MPLNVGVSSVELTEQLQVFVTASVGVVGFEPSVDYGGAISTASVPEPDQQRVSGTVGPGAGDEKQVILGTGLSAGDLPTTILVTFAIDEGPAAGEQEQVEVEVTLDDPNGGNGGNGDNGDDDGLSGRDVALAVAGVGGAAFAAQRFLRR